MTGARQEGSAAGSDILISVMAGDGQSLIYHQNIWAWDECSSGQLAWHLRLNIWTHELDLMTPYHTAQTLKSCKLLKNVGFACLITINQRNDRG